VSALYPRSLCCHEAGHAIVLHTLGVPIIRIFVAFNEAKGWYGGTESAPGSVAMLAVNEAVMVAVAGLVAEKYFKCPAHDNAGLSDMGKVIAIFTANQVADELHDSIRSETELRAYDAIASNEKLVISLIDHLTLNGVVDADGWHRLVANRSSP
jgi:hypothetical protein